MSILGVLALLSSLPAALLAFSAVVGLGLIRNLPGVLALLVAGALVLLPVAGLALMVSPKGAPRAALWGGATWLWSLAVLFGLPFYFSGERLEAASQGAGFVASIAGPGARDWGLAVGAGAAARLGSEPEPLRSARRIDDEVDTGDAAFVRLDHRGPVARGEDVVVLPYEGDGSVLRVSAFFDGPRYGEELPMIFDTGATYTTLDHESLEWLEIEIPEDAPIVVLRTANGEIKAPLVLLDGVWLGDSLVEWVTVAVCDSCASSGVVGLLGLNVTGQFLVSLNHDMRFIELRFGPREERRLDVAQWLRLGSRVRHWRDGRIEIDVTGRNRSHVGIGDVSVHVTCGDAMFDIDLDPIPAESTVSTQMMLPRDTDCSDYELELSSARWTGLAAE